MTKLLSLAAVIGVSFFCVAAAQSRPLAPLEQAASLTIPVAGGCGPGFHRGPYGGCRRSRWSASRIANWPKADAGLITHGCPLLAQSGHWPRSMPAEHQRL